MEHWFSGRQQKRHLILIWIAASLVSVSASWKSFFCPSGQYELGYLINTVIVGGTVDGFIKRWLDRLEGETSLDGPGVCAVSHISYDKVKEELELLVEKLEDGTAYRPNNLAELRLNGIPFPCNGYRTTYYSESYCGIFLGMPQVDHRIVRPYLDQILGTDTDPGSSGYRWMFSTLFDSADAFVGSKDQLTQSSIELWIVKEVHAVILDIVLTDEEALEFGEMLIPVLTSASLPPIISGWDIFGNRRRLAFRKTMTDRYETVIRELIADEEVDLKDQGNNVELAAQATFEAFLFGALPSFAATINSFMTFYVDGITPATFDTDSELGAAILETIRLRPPVLAVPYVDAETNIRQLPVVGLTGFDTNVFGADPKSYSIRFTEAEYQAKLLSWADAAVGIPGKPGTSRVCPARSLSYNMILAFIKAMDPSKWERSSSGDDVVWVRKT